MASECSGSLRVLVSMAVWLLSGEARWSEFIVESTDVCRPDGLSRLWWWFGGDFRVMGLSVWEGGSGELLLQCKQGFQLDRMLVL